MRYLQPAVCDRDLEASRKSSAAPQEKTSEHWIEARIVGIRMSQQGIWRNKVLRKFREILYGVLFGLGAALIDVAMHARMYGRGAMETIIHPSPEMAFYRILYLIFGVVLGWVFWRSSQKELRFRCLLERFASLTKDFDRHAVIVYANAQMLIMRESAQLSQDAALNVKLIYSEAQKIHALANDLSNLADL